MARALQSEHPVGPEELSNGERIGKCFAIRQHVTSIQSFVSKEPRGERLENNFAKLFGRHLSLHAMRLAAVFVGTS